MNKKIFLIWGVVAVLLGLSGNAFGSISFINPQVGPYAIGGTRPNVEAGATLKVTVRFTNDSSSPPPTGLITAIYLRINYDDTKLDPLPTNDHLIAEGSIASLRKVNPAVAYCATARQILIEKTAEGGSPISGVGGGASTNLFDVYFHVKKAATGNLSSYISVDTATLNIAYQGGGVNNYANGANPFPSIPISASIIPRFGGLTDTSLTDPGTGNTININWSGATMLNDDLNSNAETRYTSSTLSYRAYRSTSGGGAYAKIAPPTEPSTSINALPAERTPWTGSSYTYTDGAPGTRTLNDGTPYFYKVQAVDDVVDGTPAGNNETATGYRSKTPTDVTPPDPPSLSVSPGNEKNTITVGNSAGDAGGVIVIRRVGAAVTGAAAREIGGANGTTYEHGRTYAVGDSLLDGTIIFAGHLPAHKASGSTTALNAPSGAFSITFDDGGLTNGVTYHYRAIAYDRAIGVTPVTDLVEMGRNYSATSDDRAAAPGIPTDPILNFYSISRLAIGEITLKWDNPESGAPGGAKPQGGTVVWYTTNEAGKWSTIPDSPGDWTRAGDFNLLINQTRTDTRESITLSSDAGGRLFLPENTYFFKAFTYNDAGPLDPTSDASITAHRLSGGVIAAAVSTLGGAGGGTLTFSLEAYRSDRLVVNSITIPQSMAGMTASQLITAINEKARRDLGISEDIVVVLGMWDPAGNAVGYNPVTRAGSDFTLKPGVGYQLYVSRPYALTLP